MVNEGKSADPSRRDWQISYAGSKRCRWILILALNPKFKIRNPKSKTQNPKSKIRNPKSKRGRLGPPQKERRLNRSKIQNPKSKIQNPKSKIRNPKSKIQNPNSKIQTPNSKIQNPNGPVWSLDFGFGRAGAGGDGHVANEDVWPCWPLELGLVGGTQACNRKFAGSIPPTHGPNWAPISGGEVLPEIGARFPAPCRGNRGRISGETAGQAALLETLGQHRARKKPSLQIYLYLNVNIIYKSSSTLSTIPGPMQQISRVGG